MVSLSGLDLSFMDGWEPPKPAPKPREPDRRSKIACPHIMSDIKEFRSPIDGDLISSRSKLRAHELKHDVRQAGDFKPGELIAKENKRVAHSLEQAKGAVSKWE